MWISGVHIVYFCVCVLAADLGLDTERNGKQNRIKRSARTYNLYNDNYNSNKYNYNSLSTLRLRHQSRFPNLDKVMTRINNMKIGSEERTPNSGAHNKLRHNPWYERITTTTTPKSAEIFGNYFDEDYDENKEEDNNWEYEEDNEYSDYEDDDLFSESSEWQAEEPTEKPTTPTPTHRQMSKISSMKWQMYGTREKVEENRNKEIFSNYARSVSSATLAKDNFKKMNAEAVCKKPLPRVVSVQNEHPDPARSYTPQCTVLYRCADDTGCCHHHSLRCAPKTQEEVHLYFYVRTLDTLQTNIEKLTFVNHTECQCILKDEYVIHNSTIDLKSGDEKKTTPSPENLENCSCPGSFIPKKRYGSVCTCKCDENKPECRSKREGLEFFSLADRKCVLENRCGIPICEYGAFLRKKGRCPKKQEKLDAFEKLNI